MAVRATSLVKLSYVAGMALSLTAARHASATRPAFAYVNANPNNASNSVVGFRVSSSGQSTLLANAPFFTAGAGLAPALGAEFAHRIEVSSARNLLFASNDGSGTIAVFQLNPLTGGLSAAPGSPFTVPGWASFSGISLAVSNDGRFLYASGPTLVSFFIDTTGELFPIGAQWQFPQRVGGIGVSGDNTRLFISTSTTVYVLNTGEGGLTNTLSDLLSIGSSASDLRLDGEGKRLWVGTKSGGILAYTLNASGATIVPGAPFASSVTNLSGLSYDFYGRFLFAFSPLGPRLFGARTNANGALAPAPNSPLAPLFAPSAGALTPDGSLLMLADANGKLDAWAPDDNGALFHADGYPISTGATPGFAAVATFPDKNPTPAPAIPYWLAIALAAALSLLGARRLSPTTRH
jgi:hypothetical protein